MPKGPQGNNRYKVLIEKIFFDHWKEGTKEFEFRRDEMVAVAQKLKIALPKNLGFVENFSSLRLGKADIARYVLIELNNYLEADGAVGAKEDAVSLEHILPKNPGKDWSGAVPQGDDPDDWFELVGNLTLLEKPVNRGIGNKDFGAKKAKAYKPSKLAINTSISDSSTWTWKEISERSAALGDNAKTVWKLAY